MPYRITRVGNKFAIVRKADNVTVGKSDTMEKAKGSIRARMAGEYHGSVNAARRGKGEQI